MKKVLFLAVVSLFSFTICQSQMRRASVTLNDYTKCIDYCKTLSNSAEREICMKGCSSVGGFSATVSLKTFNGATSLVAAINGKKFNEGLNEVFNDAKSGLRYYAVVSDGQILDYLVKNKSGATIPSRLVSVEKGVKRCFIFVNGELIEVRCPDVIIIVHDLLIK